MSTPCATRSRSAWDEAHAEQQRAREYIGQLSPHYATNPWKQLLDLQRRLDHLMNGAFQAWPHLRSGGAFDWQPACDMKESDKQLTVHCELPGVSKDQVKVDVNRDILTISGERKEEKTGEKDRYHVTERSFGTFRRSVALPEGVDASSIQATFKDGVLEVVIPKPAVCPGKNTVRIN